MCVVNKNNFQNFWQELIPRKCIVHYLAPRGTNPDFVAPRGIHQTPPAGPHRAQTKKRLRPRRELRAVKRRAAHVSSLIQTPRNRAAIASIDRVPLLRAFRTAPHRALPFPTRRFSRASLDIYSCPAHVRVHNALFPRPSASASLGVNSTEIRRFSPLDIN